MSDFEKYLNDNNTWHDSLINVALLHYQFESIHPFYDWNGRVWRIINILYIVKEWLLDSPILYLSRYINQNKAEYYKYLQGIRNDGDWNGRIIFILTWIEKTAKQTIDIINWIKDLMMSQKHIIRDKLPKVYSQALQVQWRIRERESWHEHQLSFLMFRAASTDAAAAVQPRMTRLRSERCKDAANGKRMKQ